MKRIASAIFAAIAGIAVLAAPALAGDSVSFKSRGGKAEAGDQGRVWFVADSFSFGVEREMKESGEGPGTLTLTMREGFEGRGALRRYYESGEAIPTFILTVPSTRPKASKSISNTSSTGVS